MLGFVAVKAWSAVCVESTKTWEGCGAVAGRVCVVSGDDTDLSVLVEAQAEMHVGRGSR